MKATWRSEDGRVSLFRADCRIVLPALPANSVDFVFADPPYGHRTNDDDLIARREAALGLPRAGRPRPIAGDGPEADAVVRAAFGQFARLLRGGGCCCCCCCGGGGPDPQFARWSLWLDGPLQFVQQIVWDKGPIGMGWRYRRSYETVLVAMRRGGPMRWFDRSRRVENVIRPASGIRKIVPRSDQHPTAKPVELVEHFLRLHTQPGDLVLDPFLGRGTTAVACLRMGRRCIGIEIDRSEFRLARQRISREMKARAA